MNGQIELFQNLEENPKNKDLLEKRLACINESTIKKVKIALSTEHINPREHWESMPYLKYDLRDAICGYLSETCKKEFKKDVYAAINKEPLKRVYYGIKSTGAMPADFLNCLTDWEKVYFFAGRWAIRNPKLFEPIEVIAIKHIKEGLDSLYKHHYMRKAEGLYISELRLPEDAQIRDAYSRIVKR